MTPTVGGLLLIGLGLLLAGLAAFAWTTFSKLPMIRLRSAIFGSKATRFMTIAAGLLTVALGIFILVSAS